MSKLMQDIDTHPVFKQTSIIDQVPVIDISSLINDIDSEASRRAIAEIAEASKRWGFFQVTNHGIEDELIRIVREKMANFFALSIEQKATVMRTRENPWGFYNNELTKNQRDKKEVFDFTREGIDPIYGQANRWPAEQAEFKSIMTQYFQACTDLSLKLLEAFCLGLDLSAQFMHDDFVDSHTGFIRLNYYPVNDPMSQSSADHQPVADLGIHHHTDAGALTVLMQDEVGGLQVYSGGYWHNIPPVPGAMVINTGDMMQVWSNDIYQAAIHRVLAMESVDRYSIPFFFNPAANARVSPLPTTISDKNPSRYHEIEWSKFRGARTDGDFADYGTEVQITQFRKDT